MNEFNENFTETRINSIKKVGLETGIVSLNACLKAVPGQFFMLWIPGIGERPFTLAKTGKKPEIAVKKRGVFTEKLLSMKKGEFLGIRGPYGKGFSISKKTRKACLVAGGMGIAALTCLSEKLSEKGIETVFVYGAKNKQSLLFLERISKNSKTCIATENGSLGIKGNCFELFKQKMKEKEFDCVYCCGPEQLMHDVLMQCKKHKVKSQFAVERRMKCATGLCGHCSLDQSLVCKDGPVFSGAQLIKSKEFCKNSYGKSGMKKII